MDDDKFELASEEEILQEEVTPVPIVPVPVVVEGPARVQTLPAPQYVTRNYQGVTSSVATQVLSHEDRRSRALVLSIDQPIYVGRTPGEVESGIAAVWPDNVPLEILSGASVYVMCAAAGATTTVSVSAEYWTR